MNSNLRKKLDIPYYNSDYLVIQVIVILNKPSISLSVVAAGGSVSPDTTVWPPSFGTIVPSSLRTIYIQSQSSLGSEEFAKAVVYVPS